MKHIRLSKIKSVPRYSNPVGFASRQAGFTLIELIVTVALLAIITSFAIPGMQSFLSSNRVSTLANEFTSGLSYARGEAVNRNTCVTMCITADPTAASPTCTTALNDWNSGWIIFANPNCNASALDDRDQLLQVYEGNPAGAQLTTATGGNVRSITFTSRGVPSAVGAARRFTINTGGTTMTPVKTICLDAAGRARVGDYNSPLC
jgi:type IV fimbrial biogenesis protein FimT